MVFTSNMMQTNRILMEVWKEHWNGNSHEEGWDDGDAD